MHHRSKLFNNYLIIIRSNVFDNLTKEKKKKFAKYKITQQHESTKLKISKKEKKKKIQFSFYSSSLELSGDVSFVEASPSGSAETLEKSLYPVQFVKRAREDVAMHINDCNDGCKGGGVGCGEYSPIEI